MAKKGMAMKVTKTIQKKPAAKTYGNQGKASTSKASKSKSPSSMKVIKKPAFSWADYSTRDDQGRDIKEIVALTWEEYDDMKQHNKSYHEPPSATWKQFKKQSLFQYGWRMVNKKWVWSYDWIPQEVLDEPGLRL